jgi:integrase
MRLERWGNAWIAIGMWIATLGSRGFEPRPVAIEGGALGHCQFGRERKRLRTIPVPSWSKELLDAWLPHSGVIEGKVFRRVLKGGTRQEAGVTANVVWYAVKRCASQAGIANLVPHDLRRYAPACAMVVEENWNKFSFCLATPPGKQRNGTSAANRSFKMP